MQKPIKLRLVEVNEGKYKLKYPNLSVPVEVNENLFRKFLTSDEFVIQDINDRFFPNSVNIELEENHTSIA